VTKADLIRKPEIMVDHLAELAQPATRRPLFPAHGWWFVSPKTADENEDAADDRLIRQREDMLFGEARWRAAVDDKDGFRRGTARLRGYIYDLFGKLVSEQ
jgi:hypothetical protein